MADIELTGLLTSKKGEFVQIGTGSVRFEDDFVTAVNRSIGQINVQADLSTRIGRIVANSDTVGLSDVYEYILEQGITVHLLLLGQRKKEDVDFRALERQWEDNIDFIRQDISNLGTAADPDDTISRVGIGALGE